jgi:hypothetical protein
MKIKTLRNVALGIGCLMLTLMLSLNLISLSTSSKSVHAIKPMEDSPFGMAKSIHIIHTNQDMLNG